MTPDDRQLDDRLRGVPLPDGLAQRLGVEALFADDALDTLLRRVVAPANLVDSVRAAALASRPQGAIDLERIAGPRAQPARGIGSRLRMGIAASLRDVLAVAAALGLVAVIVAGSGELSRQLAAPDRGIDPARPAPLPAVAQAPNAVVEERLPAAAVTSDTVPSASAPPAVATAPEPATADPAPGEFAVAVAPPEPAAPPDPRLDVVRGAVVGVAAVDAGVLQPPAAVRDLEIPGESRRPVPRVRQFDIGFEMTHGEQPFVDPGAAPELASAAPPLSLETGSFDRLLFGVEVARPALPRAEHVLAALPARRPAASVATPRTAAGIRVDVHAVPSLRTTPRPTTLVEVEVSAVASRGGRGPVTATVALDRAQGSDPLVWRWICRGLAAVAAEMLPDDRVTVLVGGGLPRVVVDAGDAESIATVAAQLERLAPTAGSDLDALVRAAASGGARPGAPLVVVAHASAADHGREEVRAALSSWRAALAECSGGADLPCDRAATRFVLVDAEVPAEPPTRQPSFGRTPADPMAIRRAMLQQVFCRDTLVASQCRLEVAFDPRQVAAYRLVGHRQSAFESLGTAGPAAIDLHRGETARAVYEIVPRGSLATGGVTATVRWHDARDGAERRVAARLHGGRKDTASAAADPHDLELQLAVAVGDAIARSPYAEPRGLATAAAALARLRARGDLTDFGTRLGICIDRLGPDRRGAR